MILDDNDRLTLSIAARKLGRKQLEDVCTIFTPETVLGWYRRILAKSHTYPHKKKKIGRPSTLPEIEKKLVKIALANRLWGYGKLEGARKEL